jgi:tRNA pseudouridine32 synthase/23S rRNA pseudouridine746 synthase
MVKTTVFKTSITESMNCSVCDFLASATGLSKIRIKDAMNKGAVWTGKKKGSLRRLRRATSGVRTGTRLELYYDEKLLDLKPPPVRCIADRKDYSVWHKPAGLLAQGTMFGDHCSLIRQAELYFENKREIFLVHRLDREAAGLMLIAHSKDAAARLSELFRKNLIVKKYRVTVLGDIGKRGLKGGIDVPLDGREAATDFELVSYDAENDISIIDVTIKTGRLHQIRRHLNMIGFPVIGDPKYGKGNKNAGNGMQLLAYFLKFRCPFSNRDVEYDLNKNLTTP